jgi:hypothetical protein
MTQKVQVNAVYRRIEKRLHDANSSRVIVTQVDSIDETITYNAALSVATDTKVKGFICTADYFLLNYTLEIAETA